MRIPFRTGAWWALVALSAPRSAWAAQGDRPACVDGGLSVELAEVAALPRAGSFVELHNLTSEPVSLGDLYLTNLSVSVGPTDAAEILADRPAGAGGVFVARFPPSASVAPDQRVVVALGGSGAFEGHHGFTPDFELFEDASEADDVADLDEAYPGSVFGQGRLIEANDQVMVFCRGPQDTVTAFDAFSWGTGPIGAWRQDAPPPSEDLGVLIHRSSGAALRNGTGAGGEGRTQLPPTVAAAAPAGVSWQRRQAVGGEPAWLQLEPTPGATSDRPPKLSLALDVLPDRPLRPGASVLVRVSLRNDGGRAAEASLNAPFPQALSFAEWVVEPDGSAVQDGSVRWEGTLDAGATVSWVYLADVGAVPTGAVVGRATAANDRVEVAAEVPLQFESVTVGWVEDDDHEAPEPPSAAARAVAVTSRGEVGIESRVFPEDDDALTQDYNASVLSRAQADLRAGALRGRVRATGRFDQFDAERFALYAEELWLEVKVKAVRMRAGWQTTNWSELEAFHPADVLNSRFWDSRIENPDKFGEPMLSARVPTVSNGSLQAFLLPALVSPQFPSGASRQTLGPPGTTLGDPLWLQRDGEFSTDDLAAQWAARLEQTIKSVDVAVYALQHIDRSQPWIVFDPTTLEVRPLFRPVTQAGVTYQHVIGSAILKAEGGYRWFAGEGPTRFGPVPQPDHLLAAGGVEYGWAVGRTTHTALVEGQGLFFEEDPIRTQLNVFESDLLLGYRLGFNDRDDREVLLLGIVDVEDPGEWIGTIRYSQRLGESWVTEVGGRVVHAPPAPATGEVGLGPLRDSDVLELKISRFF